VSASDRDWRRRAAWLVLAPILPALALAPGGRWLGPLVAPLALWPAFSFDVRQRRRARAFATSLVWALLVSAGTIALAEREPQATGRGIWHAEPYRMEMFGWIETGNAPENQPARFLPLHASHLAGFAILSLISGGYLGLALGAALLAYMNYFVAAFAVSSGLPVSGAVLAWVPWAVIRVVSFVALGIVLARPMLARDGWRFDRAERRWIGWALAGILADAALKTLAAPSYGLFLRHLLVLAGRS